MARPFLSVLIDTYNHEKFIEEAVTSVLAQDFPVADREVLVVDDGSTDRTPEILARFASQIRILRKPNGGQASAFNHGIPQCRGEIIAFLDGDDWWAPTKLSAVAEAFVANPQIGLIGHGITEAFPDSAQRSELVLATHNLRLDSLDGARSFRLRKSFLGTSRMNFRADVLRRIGSVPESLVFEADEFLFTLGAVFSEVLILREPLTFYRIHGQNLYIGGNDSQSSLRRKYAVLAALVDALGRRFSEEHVPADIANTVIEAVQNEADLLRLTFEGGSPLDTIRVELCNYRIIHENASPFRRLIKYASLFPALFVSPRRYASLKQKIASNSFYRNARKRILPALPPTHVDRTGDWSPR